MFRHTVKFPNTGKTVQRMFVLLLSLQISAGQDLYGAELPRKEYQNLEYTFEVVQEHVDRQLNDTFIAATFSGGGMRAAALAYGALAALRDTTIATNNQQPDNRPLIAEVDYVSSVSGGSVTAAYWAINGPTSKFNDFGELFLKNSVQREFLGKLFEPPTFLKWVLTESSRTDELTKFFSDHIFNGITYRELLQRTVNKNDHPYLVINATDMNTRTLFPFIQLQFNLICDDLKNIEIAEAVAASAAYPVLFPAIVLENRRADRKICDRQNPYTAIERDVTAHSNVLNDWKEKVESETREIDAARKDIDRLTEDKSRWSKEIELSGTKLELAIQAMHSTFEESNALAIRLHKKGELLHALRERYKYALDEAYNARMAYDHMTGDDVIEVSKIEESIATMEMGREELTARLNDVQMERHEGDRDWLQKSTERVRRLPEDIWNLGEKIYNSLLKKEDDTRSSAVGDAFVPVSPHQDRDDSNLHIDGVQSVIEKPARTVPGLSELIGNAAEWAAIQQGLIPVVGRMGPHEPSITFEEDALDSTPADLRNEISDIRADVESMQREVNRSIEIINSILLTGALDAGDRESLAVIRLMLKQLTTYNSWQIDRVDSLESDIASGEKAVTELGKLEDGFVVDVADLEKLRSEVAAARHHAGVASRIQYVGTYWTDSIRRVRMHDVLEHKGVALSAELNDIERRLETSKRLLDRIRREATERADGLRSRLNRAEGFLRVTRYDTLRLQGEITRLEAEGLERRERLAGTRRGVVAAWWKLDRDMRDLSRVERDLEASREKRKGTETRVKVAIQAEASVEALHREYMGAVDKYREQSNHYDDDRSKYVHVLDGGSADNIGFTPLLELLDSFFVEEAEGIDNGIGDWRTMTRHVVVMVVDARAAWKETYSDSPTAPGPIDSFMTTIGTAIDGKSYLMTRELMEVTQKLVDENVMDDRYVIKVDFDAIEENFGKNGSLSECRYAYRMIPTSWNLSANVVDALVRMGRALVLNSSEYRKFHTTLETKRARGEKMRVNMPASVESVVDVCSDVKDALVEEFKERPRIRHNLRNEEGSG